MDRRLLVGAGIGALTTSIIGARPTAAESIPQQSGFRSQYIQVTRGPYHCPEPVPMPKNIYTADVFVWADDDEAWRLGVSYGPLLISVPFWDPVETTIGENSDEGFNYEGVQLRGRGRFGVRVPCLRKYRRELKVSVDVIFWNEAAGRRRVFNARGYPGTWMWLRNKSDRPYTPVCPTAPPF